MSGAAEIIETRVPRPVEPVGGAQSWYIVALLMLVYTSSFVDRTIISLLVGPIRADLKISDTQMSLLSGLAFALLYTTFGIPLGWLADRGSRKFIIAAGTAAWSVMTAACGLAQTFTQLFFARVGVGIGEASLAPAANSLISDSFPRNRLARAMSVYNVGVSLGGGLALLFGGTVIGLIAHAPPIALPLVGLVKRWQVTFMIVGIPGLILAALMLTIVEPRRRGLAIKDGVVQRPGFGEVAAYLWQRRGVYGLLYGGYSLMALVSFGFSAWIPSHFVRSYGWTAAQTGQRFGLAMLVFGTAGSLLSGVLADRLMRHGVRHAYARVALICALGLAPASLIAPLMPTGALSLVVFAVWLLFNGAWLTICAGSIQLITPNQMRGQATAIMFLFSSTIGYGLGPTAIAAITQYGFGVDTALRYALAIVGIIAMPIAAYLFKRVEQPFALQAGEMEAASARE